MTVRLLHEPDIYSAVVEFIQEFVLPDVPSENIYRGWQNWTALPAGSNEYAVVSVFGTHRRGTNVRKLVPAADGENEDELETHVHEMVQCEVQIDFCSEDARAARRAQVVETLGRDPIGVSFFKDRGISLHYAEDIGEMSFVSDDEQYVRRYTVLMRLSYWTGVSVTTEWTNAVTLRIENVDVHHKPE